MKKWYTSKTLWTNAIAFGYAIYQVVTGTEAPLSPQAQIAILSGVNWALRIITKHGLEV